jgi:16S rRNA (cytosine967-C5)-methyltransferase
LNTRAKAAAILQAVIEDGKSLSAVLDVQLPEITSPGDRAFVQALTYGVLRWYWRLDGTLTLLTRKPIRDESVRMLALIGLYQLGFMRVKPHAAVSETVSAAGNRSWAKPLLNGLLRSYQRDQADLDARTSEAETGRYAHPQWLIDRLRSDWPDDVGLVLEANNAPPPLTLRVNRLKTGREQFLLRLNDHGIAAHPSPVADDAVTIEHPMAVESIPGFTTGEVSVQDAATQLAAGLLGLEPGQRVLDLCAAPGGKSSHILETCPEIDELWAVDISAERLARIQENLNRLGQSARLVTGDALEPDQWWDQRQFDRILADAPCSATGVIRRHPDIKLLRKAPDIQELAGIQLRILSAAWPLLKPGGVLLYATCSVLRTENASVIAGFMESHADAEELPLPGDWGITQPYGRQILTGNDGMDGFYYARLMKKS